MTTTTPFHQQQIVRSLPQWSKHLPPDTAREVMRQPRKDYLDPKGIAYGWYSDAPAPDQEALCNAIRRRDDSLAALQPLLAPLQGVSEFCAPLLQARLGIEQSVLDAQYHYQATQVEQPTRPPSGPGVPSNTLPVIPKGAPQLRSLLEAALHNFESRDDTTRLSYLRRSKDEITTLPGLSVGTFIEHCRALDLGKRYQTHLSDVFDGAAAQQIRTASVQARQDVFRVQLRIATLKQQVRLAWSQALHGLCSDQPVKHELRCWQISLFGVPIHEMFLIVRADASQDPSVVLYLPTEPEPLRELPSLSQAFHHMRTHLEDTPARQRFIALAPRALQPELALRLKRALFENAEESQDKPLVTRRSVHLQSAQHVLPNPLWSHLEAEHVSRLKADARTIAVPTADVDRAVRLKHLAYWLDAGLTILNVAAMCIPAINPLMLAIAGAQITDSVFTGISAWEDGDKAEALAQLESVMLNVLVAGSVVGGTVALQASGFVDAMQSVSIGVKERLWSPGLSGYASDQALTALQEPNQLGQYWIDGRLFIRLDDVLYEQFEDTEGTWRVRHPHDPDAYSPILTHNGEGAWRLALDTPQAWDLPTLLRRVGRPAQGLSDAELASAWRSTGVNPEVLQQLHLDNQPMPTLFKDALYRLNADTRVDVIIEHVRQGLPLPAHQNFALPALVELPEWPQDHLIEVFQGTERWGRSTLYGRLPRQLGDVVIQISRSELEAGSLAETALEQMTEPGAFDTPGLAAEQRAHALQERLADHLQAQRAALYQRLYQVSAPTLSPEGTILARQFPSLPASTVEDVINNATALERERMLAANGRISLRLLEEARHLQAQVRLDRAILGLYRPTLANADTGLIIEGLQAEHPGLSGEALFETAVEQRQHCAELIGQQPINPYYRSPLALDQGRIGYPLSGRGIPRRRVAAAALRRLQALYPTLDDASINVIHAQLAQSGDVAAAMRGLEVQHRTLVQHLLDWANTAPEGTVRGERLRCAEVLNQNWRRIGNGSRGLLVLSRMEIARLPELSAPFNHIRTLRIEDIGLEHLDGGFLQSFPNLERLEITHNHTLNAGSLFEALRATPDLTELNLSSNDLSSLSETAQQALGAMRRLRVLNLSRNSLPLNDASFSLLARLPLDTLNLSSNGIVLDAAQAARFQDIVHPQVLRLDFNPLGIPPDLRFMGRLSHLSMAHCNLTTWPEGLTTLMSQPQYQLRLIDLSFNRIHALPDLDALLATPFAQDLADGVAERTLLLNYNEIEAQARTRLLRARVNVFEHTPDMPDWQLLWRADASPTQQQLWAALFDQGENTGLAGVLERLSHSAEALRYPQDLRARVWNLLQRAGEDDALLEELNADAEAFPPTCGDAGTDAFSTLEVRLMAHDASLGANALENQWRLYRRLYRRAQVNSLAERIAWRRSLRKAALQDAVASGDEANLPELDSLDDPVAIPDVDLVDGLVDDIEIRLALRQALAEQLDYPEPSDLMLYEQVAHLNAKIRRNVMREVRRLDQDSAGRRAWLVAQPQWQQTLRARYSSQFETVADFWRSGLDYLDYCLDEHAEAVTTLPTSVRATLEGALGQSLLDAKGVLRRVEVNSAQYRTASDTLLQQLKAVELGLFDSLTRPLEQSPN